MLKKRCCALQHTYKQKRKRRVWKGCAPLTQTHLLGVCLCAQPLSSSSKVCSGPISFLRAMATFLRSASQMPFSRTPHCTHPYRMPTVVDGICAGFREQIPPQRGYKTLVLVDVIVCLRAVTCFLQSSRCKSLLSCLAALQRAWFLSL